MKKSTRTANGSVSEFPPYGYMNALYMWDVDTRRSPDGLMIDGRPITSLDWRSYVESTSDELAEFLWPRYDPRRKCWVGAATDNMSALTEADFVLMKSDLSKLLIEPAGTVEPLRRSTHKLLFQEEDESKPGILYPTLDAYVPNVAAEVVTRLKESIKRSLVAFGPGPLRFKELLQRPRPYQMAYLWQREFSLELARSSMTPSVPSGHSLQGMLGRCAGYMATRLQLEEVAGSVIGLQTYSVDIGDRRVYAGIHYPSDNIASWFIALRLCDHLFGEVGHIAKRFMCEAIARSQVFKAMKETAARDLQSPYVVPLRRLEDEMNRPANRSEDS